MPKRLKLTLMVATILLWFAELVGENRKRLCKPAGISFKGCDGAWFQKKIPTTEAIGI